VVLVAEQQQHVKCAAVGPALGATASRPAAVAALYAFPASACLAVAAQLLVSQLDLLLALLLLL
jgi:hypothetical protein